MGKQEGLGEGLLHLGQAAGEVGWARPVHERRGFTGRRRLSSGPAQCRSHGHKRGSWPSSEAREWIHAISMATCSTSPGASPTFEAQTGEQDTGVCLV